MYKSQASVHILGHINSLHDLQTNYRYFSMYAARRSWWDNIKMFLKEVVWQSVGWNHRVENKDKAGSCKHRNEPENIVIS
jgi:hypothetical protein